MAKETESKVKEDVTEEPKKVSLKAVTLKGTAPQKVGTHSVFVGKRVITFINGKAELENGIADEVIKAGYGE